LGVGLGEDSLKLVAGGRQRNAALLGDVPQRSPIGERSGQVCFRRCQAERPREDIRGRCKPRFQVNKDDEADT
jgi:hypothetical protein